MTITENQVGGAYILTVSGRIDTATAGDAQQKILLSFQKTINVVLDITDVEYISSSGLRAILLGQKTAQSKRGSFIIRGASAEVKKLFAMVGFDKILNFE